MFLARLPIKSVLIGDLTPIQIPRRPHNGVPVWATEHLVFLVEWPWGIIWSHQWYRPSISMAHSSAKHRPAILHANPYLHPAKCLQTLHSGIRIDRFSPSLVDF